MPELPEVETIVNYIKPLLINKNFVHIKVNNRKLRINIFNDFEAKLVNSKILNITRIAKYILINLDNDLSIVIHLGMTGKLFAFQKEVDEKKHDHIIFTLNDGSYLCYNDIRKFGLVSYIKTDELKEHSFFKYLGIEPLSEKFDSQYLF